MDGKQVKAIAKGFSRAAAPSNRPKFSTKTKKSTFHKRVLPKTPKKNIVGILDLSGLSKLLTFLVHNDRS